MTVAAVVWGVAVVGMLLGAAAIFGVERSRGEADPHMRATWLQSVGILAVVLGPATIGGSVAVVGTCLLAVVAVVDVLRCAGPRGHTAPALGLGGVWLLLVGAAALRLPAAANTLGEVAFLFGVLEIGDSTAYLVGRTFGRRKLAPTLSPGKTIEGTLAGMVGAALAGALLSLCIGERPLVGGLIGLGLGPAGLAADLLVSALKRRLGVKDFGSYLPASGSVADIFDSYLLLLPLWVGLRTALA